MPALIRRKAGKDFNAFKLLGSNFVGAQQQRPFTLNSVQDGMRQVSVDLGTEAFRHFNPVIIGEAVHRQGLLHRRAMPAGAAINALKAEVTAEKRESLLMVIIATERLSR